MSDEPQRPTPGDSPAWGDDISDERKAQLEERLQVWAQENDHGGRKGPFDGEKLTGADVFWLAARTLAGTDDRQALATQMQGLRRIHDDVVLRYTVNLSALHLEGTHLVGAQLDGAFLPEAHLERANLIKAHLQGANLSSVHLEGAFLSRAQLEGALLREAHLEQADLRDAQLDGVLLSEAYLERAGLIKTHLQGAYLGSAHLEGALLSNTHLERADLSGAHLEGAHLNEVHLEGAILSWAHLEGRVYRPDEPDYRRMTQWVDDFPLALAPTDLRGTYFDNATALTDVTLGWPGHELGHGYVQVADVRWGGVNLAVVDWSAVAMLGDERVARGRKATHQTPSAAAEPQVPKPSRQDRQQARQQMATERLHAFQVAARANRQLATVLRAQGITDDADHFAYRAQLCQRPLLCLQRHYLRYLGSLFLWLIAGYGYKPMRSLISYVVIILTFAGAYLLNAQFAAPHLTWDEALVLSISSFHGRGFFTSGISLGDTLARLAAGEAVIGLLIEITFIATFTQRFFAR